MSQDRVAAFPVFLRQIPAHFRVLEAAKSGLEQAEVPLQYSVGRRVEQALLVAGSFVPADPGPGDVGAVSIGADHVGIERNHVSGLYDAITALLIPRRGLRT